MLLILFVSTVIAISSSSWVIIWVIIEINSISICSLISNEINNENEQNSQALIYLIIQLSSSIVILVSAHLANNNSVWYLLTLISLIINVGTWPFHLWYINTLSIINTNHNTINVLITWQNLLPFIVIPYIATNYIFIFISIITILTPLNNLMNGSSFNTVIISSSVNNNGWLTVTSLLSPLTFILYFIIYSFSLVITLNFFKSLNTNNSVNTNNYWESIIMVGNISGIPPMLMFLGNIIILLTISIILLPNEFSILIIVTACIFTYHYIWSSSNFLTNMSTNTQLWNNENSTTPQVLIFLSSFITLLLLM